MKVHFLCFFVFSLGVLLLAHAPVSANTPLNGVSFVLDAGHGGVDPGTVVGSVYEKDINLKIVLALKSKLENLGAQVVLTRSGDYDLGVPKALSRKRSDFDHRISLINHSGADFYISIHLNYLSDASYYGPQVFYSPVLSSNYDLALKLQESLNSKLGTHRSVKKISSSIYMYSKLDVVGVLLECGFLSNAMEREKLLSDSYIDLFTSYVVDSFV